MPTLHVYLEGNLICCRCAYLDGKQTVIGTLGGRKLSRMHASVNSFVWGMQNLLYCCWWSALELFACSLLFVSICLWSTVKLLSPSQFKTRQNAPALLSEFPIKRLGSSGEMLGNNLLPARYLWQMRAKSWEMFASMVLKHKSPLSSQQWHSPAL